MTRAYAYARFSSENQNAQSIDAQLQAIREYAHKQDIHVVRIFTDAAESARSDDRPAFQSMIEAARFDPPDLILVHKLDRFSRNRYDAAVYRRKLKDYGVRLVSVLEPLDDSPESVILESVLEGMSEYYSRNLAREVMKGMRQVAQRGLWTGGRPPLGYTIGSDRKLQIEPEGAATVRRIFDLFLQGFGYAAIATQLNKEGLKTSQGTVWYKSSIHTILTNERYTGVSIFNQRASAREDGTRNSHAHKDGADIIRVEDAWEPIIDQETWCRVQGKMAKRKKGPQPRRNDELRYLLTGLAYCGECGSAFVGAGYRSTRSGQKAYFYSCVKRPTRACSNHTVGRDWLESRVISELKSCILNDAAINALVPRVLEQVALRDENGVAELEALRAQVKSSRAKIARLLDMVEEGTAGPDVADRIKERRAEVDRLEARTVELQKQQPGAYITAGVIRRFLLVFREHLDSSDQTLKRKALETFIERIEVFPIRVVVKFKFEPGGDDQPPTNKVDRVGLRAVN